jgi:hypothetical protein
MSTSRTTGNLTNAAGFTSHYAVALQDRRDWQRGQFQTGEQRRALTAAGIAPTRSAGSSIPRRWTSGFGTLLVRAGRSLQRLGELTTEPMAR